MRKILKQPRRAFRRRFAAWREGLSERMPRAARAIGPGIDHLDMLLIDHGIFRLAYLNKHAVTPGVWRSAQPAPHDIARAARDGVRTIVNLRGERDCGAYRLQMAAARRHGIVVEELILKSRAAPTPEQVRAAKALFDRVEHPILMHCKSGADRAGLGATLYLILHEGRPVAEAMAQLSARYGHFRQADTGIIDAFFERYLADTKDRPMPFLDWVEQVYDPARLTADFRSGRWANLLVNRVLRRE